MLGVGEAGVRRATAPPPSAPPTRSGPALDPRDCRGVMGIAAPPWRSGTSVFALALSVGRICRPASAEDPEILLNKIEAVIQQNRALLRPLSSCGFYALQPPAIPIAPLHRTAQLATGDENVGLIAHRAMSPESSVRYFLMALPRFVMASPIFRPALPSPSWTAPSVR